MIFKALPKRYSCIWKKATFVFYLLKSHETCKNFFFVFWFFKMSSPVPPALLIHMMELYNIFFTVWWQLVPLIQYIKPVTFFSWNFWGFGKPSTVMLVIQRTFWQTVNVNFWEKTTVNGGISSANNAVNKIEIVNQRYIT